MAAAYQGGAWAGGPERVYDCLAAALVAASPMRFTGAHVLDVGAGLGAVSKFVIRAGGFPIAVDLSLEMLCRRSATRTPAVVADARRLPMMDSSADAAILAFVLSHVPDPLRALSEARRVVRPGGVVLASTFSSGPSHPAKAAVDEVAGRWGWRPPPWYQWLKTHLEPQVGNAAALAEVAGGAGLHDVVVKECQVDTGISSPDVLLAWRLGMAHLSLFVASLTPARRATFVAEARAAVGPESQPLRPFVLMLSSSAPAQRERMSA